MEGMKLKSCPNCGGVFDVEWCNTTIIRKGDPGFPHGIELFICPCCKDTVSMEE